MVIEIGGSGIGATPAVGPLIISEALTILVGAVNNKTAMALTRR